ncbi:hypothetical protein JMN32_20695 [Fulvivirga sp. 29W222]|uniref:Outer membrane protein beta-barrel domain-containing protein n=1 Tax=Fulvivirga marina TaxID=2494733 RepID=A0A937KG21_9BACT|nr:hypothetical protein [Fulvivirga marina]MBL6448743.1 hypothetical protein [Fulvivirga marina]
MKWLLFIFIVLSGTSGITFAQSVTRANDTTSTDSYVRLGLRYKSDYFYMGRADSAKAPYFVPTVGYYHKSGLFINGGMSYLATDTEGRIDLFTVTAGYDYFGKKLMTGISISEYFFSDQSYAVQAEMNTFLSAYAGYDFEAFMLITDASLGFSESTDFFLGAELSRMFYMARNKLIITPSFYTNLGTQRYYNEYYTKRSITTGSGGSGKGHGSGSNGGSSSTTMNIEILEYEKFQILDYELGIQATYKLKQLRFTLAGTLLFPVNPSTVVTDQETYEEDLETGFLWSASIRYLLK